MASLEDTFPLSCCQLLPPPPLLPLLTLSPAAVPRLEASDCRSMEAPVSSEGTQHSLLPPQAAVALAVGRSARHLGPSRAMSKGTQYPCTAHRTFTLQKPPGQQILIA